MAGQKAESPLSQMRVAAPCQQSWDTMSGNDQVRFCSTCYKKVYKFSNLNRAQAIQLVTAHEGRACVAYYRRADGSIMAEECPIGLRRVQRPFQYARVGLALLLLPLFGFTSLLGISKLAGVPTQQGHGMVARLRTMQPFATIANCLDPLPEAADWVTGPVPIAQLPTLTPGFVSPPPTTPAVTYSYYTRPMPEKVNLITPGYRVALRKFPKLPHLPPMPHPSVPLGAGAPPHQDVGHVAP